MFDVVPGCCAEEYERSLGDATSGGAGETGKIVDKGWSE